MAGNADRIALPTGPAEVQSGLPNSRLETLPRADHHGVIFDDHAAESILKLTGALSLQRHLMQTDTGLTPAAKSNERILGFLSAAGVFCIWSGFLVFSRAGMQSGLTPFDLAALRFMVTGALVLPFAKAWWPRHLPLHAIRCQSLAPAHSTTF
ncbi:hypothetical protein ABIG06_000393 [Bradyrhizobium sp. USDA 326]|uniref:hypothetical protein n=1 Tax=unclassified Bradyrhizobium TaxID=2631580 RepID=UPI003512EEB5